MACVRRFLTATLLAMIALPQIAHADSLQPAYMIQIPGTSFNNEAGVASRNAPPRIGGTTDFIRFDAKTNLIYLTDGPNLAVDVFDPNAQAMVERIPLTNGPHDAIVDDNLNLMIAPLSNQPDHGANVEIVNLTNGAVTDIDVGGTSIADLSGYDPVNHLFAVGSKGQSQLSFIQIDPDKSTLLGQEQLGDDSPEEPYFWKGNFIVAGPRNAVLVVDPNSMTTAARWDVPGCSGHGFAKGPGSEAYLGCSRGGVILNLDTGAVVATFAPSQAGDTDQPTYDASSNRYYAPGHVSRNGADVAVLAVIDAGSHQLINTINIDPGSGTQAAADANGVVWISTEGAVGGACLSACLFGYQP